MRILNQNILISFFLHNSKIWPIACFAHENETRRKELMMLNLLFRKELNFNVQSLVHSNHIKPHSADDAQAKTEKFVRKNGKISVKLGPPMSVNSLKLAKTIKVLIEYVGGWHCSGRDSELDSMFHEF